MRCVHTFGAIRVSVTSSKKRRQTISFICLILYLVSAFSHFFAPEKCPKLLALFRQVDDDGGAEKCDEKIYTCSRKFMNEKNEIKREKKE